MIERILNTSYYLSLTKTFTENIEYNSSLLPITKFTKINLSFIDKSLNSNPNFDIIIKIPNYCYEILDDIFSNLYLYIANTQFYENYDNPILKINQKVQEKNGKRIYKIIDFQNGNYDLEEVIKENLQNRYPAYLKKRSYENIINNFRIIRKRMKGNTIHSFLSLFCKLYNLDPDSDLIPTEFNSVSIIIGQKLTWESFKNIPFGKGNLWKAIPSAYISRDGKKTESISIAPLIYFSSSYQIAYQEVIRKQIKVNNIVLFNEGFDELQQIINDQSTYDFRILGICTSPIEKGASTIKYWEWLKEEIDLIGLL